MKVFVTLSIVFMLLLTPKVSSQKFDCSRMSGVTAENQEIRNKTYQMIGLVTDPKYQIDEKVITQLGIEYIGIQESFNATFTAIRKDLKNLAGRRIICDRYGDKLSVDVAKATAFNEKLSKTLTPGGKASGAGTIDLVTGIIDWIEKKVEERGDNFYDEVEWKDWAVVVREQTEKRTGQATSTTVTKTETIKKETVKDSASRSNKQQSRTVTTTPKNTKNNPTTRTGTGKTRSKAKG